MKRCLTTIVFTLALAGQAAAGGVLSFNFNAQNSNQANAIRSGLVLYQIYKDIDTNGHISQRGINNAARLAQGGRGNIGIIHQDGSDHNASLTQRGGYNSCGVFQSGRGANFHGHQNGGGACIVLQHGF